jgi:hypothetical protein
MVTPKIIKSIAIKRGKNTFLGGQTLKTEAAGSSETLTPIYQTK